MNEFLHRVAAEYVQRTLQSAFDRILESKTVLEVKIFRLDIFNREIFFVSFWLRRTLQRLKKTSTFYQTCRNWSNTREIFVGQLFPPLICFLSNGRAFRNLTLFFIFFLDNFSDRYSSFCIH